MPHVLTTTNTYPDNWVEIAYQTKHSTGFTCQCCHQCQLDTPTLVLNAHHIDLNPLNNDPSNLLCLCQSCHLRLHAILAPQMKRLRDYYNAISYGQIPLKLPQELTPQPLEATLNIIRQIAKAYTTK